MSGLSHIQVDGRKVELASDQEHTLCMVEK